MTVLPEAITDEEWDRFVMESDYGGFMQSAAWARVKSEEGWGARKIAIRTEGKIIAGALVLYAEMPDGYPLLYSPQGPVLPWDEDTYATYLDGLIQLVSSLATATNAPCWRVEPWALHTFSERLRPYPKAGIDMQPRDTALIPLFDPAEIILSRFKQKVRYNINLAIRHGVEIEIGSSERDFERFYSIYRKTVDRKDIDFKEYEYFDSIRRHLGTIERAYCVTAVHEGTPVASLLLIRFGEKLTYFFGGFDYQHRHLMAPFLCHFAAIKLGRELGCHYYDLWGIANTDDEGHPWHSITVFKSNFQPLKITLVGSRDIVFDKAGYDVVRRREGS